MSEYWERIPQKRKQPKPRRQQYVEEEDNFDRDVDLYDDAQRVAPKATEPPQLTPQGQFRFPEHLERRGNAPRPRQAPRATPATYETMDRIQQRREDIKAYHEENPEDAEVRPAPKKRRRFKFSTGMLAVFFIMSIIGLAMAAMNFWYARGMENLSTSVSFLHAEIGLVFVAMISGFVVLDMGNRGG